MYKGKKFLLRLLSRMGLYHHRKEPLNLAKIRLYCVLQNVQKWQDVPRCNNCRFRGIECIGPDENQVRSESNRLMREGIYCHYEGFKKSADIDEIIPYASDEKFRNFRTGWKRVGRGRLRSEWCFVACDNWVKR